MKKRLFILLAIIFLAWPAWASQYLAALSGLTGGTTGKLDNIYTLGSSGKYSTLADNDVCWVYDTSAHTFVPYYFYIAGTPQVESSPTIIVPDWQSPAVAYTGNGAWLRAYLDAATLTGTISADLVNTAYPWSDNEVSDTITVGASGSVNDAAIPAAITRDIEWNTVAKIETATGANIIQSTEIESISELNALTGVTILTSSSSLSGSLLDIHGTTAETAIADDDEIIIYDTSEGVNRRMTKAHFVLGLGGGTGMTWPGTAGIMVYAGGSAYGTSLTAPSGTIVGTTDSQSLENKKLGSLTSNGFVKTSGSDGTLSVDTNTYLTPSGNGSGLTAVNAATLESHAASYFATAGANSNITSLSGLTTPLSMAQGGTGVALTDPGSHVLYGWDNTDNVFRAITIGNNLSYDHATYTLSASSTAGSTFDSIVTGTNTTATMTVGTGGTITYTGSGVINASTLESHAASYFQVADAELGYLAGLTFADASIIQLTGTTSAEVLTSGGNNYILGSNSDNSALEFKTPANVLSQIGAAPAAGSTSIVTIGAATFTSLVQSGQTIGSNIIVTNGFSVGSDGALTCKSLTTARSATQAGGWVGYELSGESGDNWFAWDVPDAITANRTFKMIDTDPSAGQVMAWTLSGSTITESWVSPALLSGAAFTGQISSPRIATSYGAIWDSSGINIPTGDTYKINGTSIFATSNSFSVAQTFTSLSASANVAARFFELADGSVWDSSGITIKGAVTADSYSTVRADTDQYVELYERTSAEGDEYFRLVANPNITKSFNWVVPAVAAGGSNYLINVDADGTMGYTDPSTLGGGGGGTLTTLKEANSGVGDADIVTIDFGAGFDLSEGPNTEINVALDLTEYSGAAIGSTSGQITNIYMGDAAVIYGQADQSNYLTSSATGWATSLDLTITGSDLILGTSGVKLTGDGDGAITFLGLGDGSDEDLTLNLDDTPNTGVFSSSTGLATLDFGAIALYTTGGLSGKVPIEEKSSTSNITAEPYCYGGIVTNTGASGAIVLTLPDAVKGMSLKVILTVAQDVDINPQDGEQILVKTNAAGDALSSDATIGSACVLIAVSDTQWMATTEGTWSDVN